MTARAGRLLLEEIRSLTHQKVSFAFETTLSGLTYVSWIKRMRSNGYTAHLIYLWPQSVELALQRIRKRVAIGGHDVPEPDVRRRFTRSARNLFAHYQPIVDSWMIVDNGGDEFATIAHAAGGQRVTLRDDLFEPLRESAGIHA